jgi:hypothetical protein
MKAEVFTSAFSLNRRGRKHSPQKLILVKALFLLIKPLKINL